jgi:prevent-host-death family protein
MLTVGIRELKANTSEIIRRVRERGEVVDITYHGEVVARLAPVAPRLPAPAETAAILADLDQLAAEISAAWPEGVSALDAVQDVRREL